MSPSEVRKDDEIRGLVVLAISSATNILYSIVENTYDRVTDCL